MNRTDIDYIIEKLEFYKPDNIYDGYNSEREKRDQRVSEVLDSIIAEIKSDYENMRTPMPKELVLTCKLDKEQMQRLKEQIESAKMSIESVKESKWIKCSEQEPPGKTSVLIYDGESIITGFYEKEKQIYDLSANEIKDSDLVTHWMPLPEPPKEGLKC